MDKYFTTQIFVNSESPRLGISVCQKIDVQITPFAPNGDTSVEDVALYWQSAVKRRKEYPNGNYVVISRLSHSTYASILFFNK